MATNLTPPVTLCLCAFFFHDCHPVTSYGRFWPSFRETIFFHSGNIWCEPTSVSSRASAASPFFTDAPASFLHFHFHRQPLRNLAVVKPSIGLFSGLMEFSPFLQVYDHACCLWFADITLFTIKFDICTEVVNFERCFAHQRTLVISLSKSFVSFACKLL